MLSMLEEWDRTKKIVISNEKILGKKVDNKIPNTDLPKKQLLRSMLGSLRDDSGGQNMETVLQLVDGVEKVLTLMIIHLCFPDLRPECQALCEIPLATFTSVSKIEAYLQDIIKFGVSTEMRGQVFVMGNTSTGKTSFVRTLKEFSEHPERWFPKSFLTEDLFFITDYITVSRWA